MQITAGAAATAAHAAATAAPFQGSALQPLLVQHIERTFLLSFILTQTRFHATEGNTYRRHINAGNLYLHPTDDISEPESLSPLQL